MDINIEDIEGACELVNSNLVDLSFENNRFAMEALNINIWLDNDQITIEGAIPMSESTLCTIHGHGNP